MAHRPFHDITMDEIYVVDLLHPNRKLTICRPVYDQWACPIAHTDFYEFIIWLLCWIPMFISIY